MRHGRSAKQRVWLGPGGYRGRCRDAATNPDAESYADSNSFTYTVRAGNSYTDANADSNANGHPDRHPDGHAHGDTNGNSTSYSYTNSNRYPDTHSATYADTYSKWDTHSDPGSNRAASTESRT
jgi:hypothetical protein